MIRKKINCNKKILKFCDFNSISPKLIDSLIDRLLIPEHCYNSNKNAHHSKNMNLVITQLGIGFQNIGDRKLKNKLIRKYSKKLKQKFIEFQNLQDKKPLKLNTKYSSQNDLSFSIQKKKEDIFFLETINKEYFNDTSLFIKDVIESTEKNIIKVMPQKTGKSFNIRMLNAFLEVEFDEFDNIINPQNNSLKKIFFDQNKKLNISNENISWKTKFGKNYILKSDQIQGISPVIFLEFKELVFDTYGDFIESFISLFYKLFKKFTFLGFLRKNYKFRHIFNYENFYHNINNNPSEIYDLIKSLIIFLNGLFPRENIWVLIDDFDYPILKALQVNLRDLNFILQIVDNLKKILMF